MLSIQQKLSQTQKLTPQQIQYQKLLQLNNLALEQRIKEELELNPMLEEELDLKTEQDDDERFDEDENFNEDNEFTVEDYMNDEDYYNDPSSMDQREETFRPIARSRESFSEKLLQQLYMLDISEDLTTLGEEIIGNLDDDGYLARSLEDLVVDLATFQNIVINHADAEELLRTIQAFDPPGIATRDLRECLLVQLQTLSYDPYYSFLAEKLLNEHYDAFLKKHYNKIREEMALSEETFASVIRLITKLNPKPGAGDIDNYELNQITPDFIIDEVDGEFKIEPNDRSIPSVTLSKTYLEMVAANKATKNQSEREKQTYKFLREKFESAKWFIACIEQRRDTMMKVMQSIVEFQQEFFMKGVLKPLRYKDVAGNINMDISTISRVVNGKFVQSRQGIHELKYFFSEGLMTDEGEEVSNKEIKERIKLLIEAENKSAPLSDDKIADTLKAEGVQIARRTVTKYRESMRIPVARYRKEV
ncbi:MAG: RNA polymerase factor sigma-54 [Ignavibacteriaceae bacterium]|jgi:RNA polymerase sigma-54 factor|nr:MAG: RNA polymerase factor sigma-54 [Ignavibacteriaceae bacterium]MBV6444726.1 RNA polymerase sigma-54 factor [Ignavibacteriaceae bacterium]MBW7873299.1 RNA polymerase factor sigma-54 [Ignavibacteria bacterium]MBZ0196548.1 RNA polymerase factor sigma-54 [Ignavibacteriaceae bacterium]OQY77645.1 MAG: RNA polymerase sigma-54 factor [Ignavibacteriales bacterium UTCHB3]